MLFGGNFSFKFCPIIIAGKTNEKKICLTFFKLKNLKFLPKIPKIRDEMTKSKNGKKNER